MRELRPKEFGVYAGVAQWLESLPSKQTVVGSSPIARSMSIYNPSKEMRIRNVARSGLPLLGSQL